MDLFVACAYQDLDHALALGADLSARGSVVGEPLVLWPGQRPLPMIDLRLRDARHALVIVSRQFLKSSYPRKDLDGLAIRRRVVALLSDVVEEDVARHSPRLAVAAHPGAMAGRLARLF